MLDIGEGMRKGFSFFLEENYSGGNIYFNCYILVSVEIFFVFCICN